LFVIVVSLDFVTYAFVKHGQPDHVGQAFALRFFINYWWWL